ncbi:sensor domain-containing protein [Bacillus sp. AK031]
MNQAIESTNDQRLKNIKEALDISSIVAITDRAGMITYVNETFCKISKYSREELIGQSHRIINSGHHSRHFFRNMWRTISSGAVWKGQVKNRAKDGTYYWVDTVIVPFLDEKNRPYQYISIRTDITEKKALEEEISSNEERLKAMNQYSSEGVAIVDSHGLISYMSPSYEKITGNKVDKVINNSVMELIHKEDYDFYKNQFQSAVRKTQVPIRFQVRAIHGDGLYYVHELVMTNFLNHPSINGIVINFREITEEKRAQQQMSTNAFYDSLTSFPNRNYFKSRLKSLISAEKPVTLVVFNIDDFKHINDLFGYEAGDQLLQKIAGRISKSLTRNLFAARIAGDEFALICTDDRISEQDLGSFLLDLFKEPFDVDGQRINITVSAGISRYPDDTSDKQILLNYATNALRHSKQKGKNNYKGFDSSIKTLSYRSFVIKNDLRKAIEQNELDVHFQPRINTKTQKTESFEALIRWNHPELGPVAPGEFIPAAERSNLMNKAGHWIFMESCKRLKEVNQQFRSDYKISINLSPQQLLHDDVVKDYLKVVSDLDIAPSLIELEITESAIIHNKERVKDILRSFREHGFSLALDDFGTGFSSLNYIQEFRTDVIKMDRSFVKRITLDKESYLIARMIINLAHELGIRVVGEGVETEEQLVSLKNMGCDEIQGYLFSKPLPYRNLVNYLWNK